MMENLHSNSAGSQHASDLEERAFQFAKAVRLFIKNMPKTMAVIEDEKQLVSASGCAGANYIEANEALSGKDFIVRAKISRKKVKESRYWLRLINETNDLVNADEARTLIREADELEKILTSIVERSKWQLGDR
ncbi:MAG TPA: four helix bundle protein [Candidatus Kryptobacter bacterium]|nr:four helix bundle protein [Candidatus Kryptobacter bacterium]